ncbi:hypothetical protein ATCC90586_002051 [Pythium insidiosum]|nr:hypothetical protein ATCC90586_002051 [Pythium insidiosum]
MGNVQQYIGKRVEVAQYQVEVTKYLGEGGSSFIFLVRDVQRESAKPMVLKRLLAENDAAFQWIQREIDMHQRFRHASVVEFYASQVNRKGRTEREVFILMEFCPSGHLYENMTKMGEKRFSEKELLQTFRSLCVPVHLMHSQDPPVAHRDLKLENFLMAQNGAYKLCDFGSCVIGPQSLRTKEDRAREAEHVLKRTTAMYRSPELADVEGTAMFGSGELTEAVDVWAMGCSPFPPDGLRTERYTIPKESKYSPDVHQLIARMLQADVERRASMAHVLECIDELLAGRALPKSSGGAPSPKKAAAPPPAAERRTNSATKTAEARKETVAAPKPASDLLDMDFNPTISTPAPAAAATKTVDPFNAAWGSSAPATAAAPTGGFADFANFPSSPRAFGAATAPTPSSFDAFGFPASPVKAQGMQPTAGMAQPAFGFAPPAPQAFGAPPPPAPPAAPVDPFEGLGGLGPAAMPTTGPRPMYPGQQGFQPMGQPQQAMWGQQQQQQPQQMWGAPGGGGFSRGF